MKKKREIKFYFKLLNFTKFIKNESKINKRKAGSKIGKISRIVLYSNGSVLQLHSMNLRQSVGHY